MPGNTPPNRPRLLIRFHRSWCHLPLHLLKHPETLTLSLGGFFVTMGSDIAYCLYFIISVSIPILIYFCHTHPSFLSLKLFSPPPRFGASAQFLAPSPKLWRVKTPNLDQINQLGESKTKSALRFWNDLKWFDMRMLPTKVRALKNRFGFIPGQQQWNYNDNQVPLKKWRDQQKFGLLGIHRPMAAIVWSNLRVGSFILMGRANSSYRLLIHVDRFFNKRFYRYLQRSSKHDHQLASTNGLRLGTTHGRVLRSWTLKKQ